MRIEDSVKRRNRIADNFTMIGVLMAMLAMCGTLFSLMPMWLKITFSLGTILSISGMGFSVVDDKDGYND